MKKFIQKILPILMLGSAAANELGPYPVEVPRSEGYFQVSDKHQLYYALYGNPEGVPVVILHGGPGAGCRNEYTQFFDLKYWNVVMFDQRGAMRSSPFASMEENTAQHCTSDIEVLRKHLGIHQWALFGNSWGSCLALLYGQAYPESCLGFILEGTFLGREKDIGFFRDMGKTSQAAYQEFLTHFSEAEQEGIPKACYQRLTNPDPQVHMDMARATMRLLLLDSKNPPSPEIIEKILSNDRYILSCIRAIAHYAIHQCFLEPDQVLSNMDKISHLPAIIVHGSQDAVNLPEQAAALHENWKDSLLWMIEGAGHSCFEPDITKALVQASNRFLLNSRVQSLLDMSPDVVRQLRHKRIFNIEAPMPTVRSVEDQNIQRDSRTTSVRIYKPSKESLNPVILYIHGGGWVAGNLDTHDNLARYLCSNTDAAVISVGYLNSPEGKFPLPLEQCYDALVWITEHADDYSFDPTRIAVVGDSGGGNMSAALCLMARDRKGPRMNLQVLINPSTDLTGGGTLEPQKDVLDTLRWEATQYLSDPRDANNSYASPLMAPDLSHLPPAVVILAEKDILRESGQKYAERLLSAGVPTLTYCQKDANHLAGHGARASQQAKESLDVAVKALREAFGGLKLL